MTETYLLRLPAVIAATQLSRSTLYAAIQRGTFPAPVRVGERAVRWRRQDVDAWLEKLATNSTPLSDYCGRAK